MRMHRIIMSCVACLAVQYFSAMSHKEYDFREKKIVTEHKTCVLILSTNLSAIFLTLTTTERNIKKKRVLVFM